MRPAATMWPPRQQSTGVEHERALARVASRTDCAHSGAARDVLLGQQLERGRAGGEALAPGDDRGLGVGLVAEPALERAAHSSRSSAT